MTGHAAIFILAEAVGRIMHQNPALVKYLKHELRAERKLK